MGIINKRSITKEAFKVVGLEIDWMPTNENPSENAIAKLWDQFNKRFSEIQNAVPHRCYGLIRSPDGMKPGVPFKYMACTEVSDFPSEIPNGMITAEIPRFEYAVLTYQGVIDEIGYANEYFGREWAPQLEGFRIPYPHSFEFYGKDFTDNDDPESIFELWFPLVGK